MTTELPVDLLASFFGMKQVRAVVILSCVPLRQRMSILKEMSARGFLVSFSQESPFTSDPHRLGGVLDLRCGNFDDFIEKMTKDRLFLPHHEWLLIDEIPVNPNDVAGLKVPVQTVGLSKFANAYMLPGSFVTVAQFAGPTIHFYDVYRIHVNRPLKFHLLDSQPKAAPSYVLPKPPNRSDFENITLNAITVIYKFDLFTTLDDPDRPDVDAWAKIHYPVAKHMEEQLNFVMNLSIADDYGWAVNGTFNGIMGYFQRGEADIGATALFMRNDRIPLVDFTSVCFDLGSTMIFKQPRLSSVSNIFLLPFSKPVWLGIGVLSLCVIVFLGLELILNRHLSPSPSYNEEHTSVIDIVTFVAGFICQQGSNIMPQSLASRVAVFTFSLSVVFFYTSYSANIVALLRSTPPILKTLADLTASHLDIIVEDRKYNVIYFKESTDPNVHDLYDKKVKPHLSTAFVPPKLGISKIRTGEYAYNVLMTSGDTDPPLTLWVSSVQLFRPGIYESRTGTGSQLLNRPQSL
ncbi:hypothetical protein GE061_018270 [Apolygus lucorum]|uniref:Ionotropic glutamate receptor C-terminal domain-containing protein n=1 Tax=Apolygus lucorum TaxID=248454 RepID=A0A8S9XDD9_APOLU|nr:hypothetical protein GE061_018270 [Apolygus lucorum]